MDVCFVQVSPMDKQGFFNFSTSNSLTIAHCQKAKTVIVEVNNTLPICLGGNGEAIHISQVDIIVEGPNNPLVQLQPAAATDVEREIAKYVMGEIEDGACLQLGIGGLPNVVGAIIAVVI
jgi:acyl-CoA hydrolase